METKFQTSFIPKQPVTDSVRHSSGSGLLFVISFIVLIASLAAGGGVFLYGQYVDTSISEGKKQLERNENAFDPTTIQELTRLNDRISSVDVLLKQHVAVSNVFTVLSGTTLKNVRFNDFSFVNAGGGKVTMSMKGQATSYETVALQSRAFTDPSLRNVFRSPIFGDLNLDQSGNVTFSFSASVDPTLVSYYKSIKDRGAAIPGTIQPTQ
ncbi:MAG: hypothetical protein RL094_779 [Candidatus Parcubacteria bacterium]|jgi:hypothetical protein